MNESPLVTGPPSRRDQLLQDKLIEDIAGQGARMDDLAHRLIALDLAVPGIYVTALKLVAGTRGRSPASSGSLSPSPAGAWRWPSSP